MVSATTLKSTTTPTRRVKPSHEEWKPSEGQSQAVDFLCSTASAALWADPGAGKTSITFAAYTSIHDQCDPRAGGDGVFPHMLVVAPLRVAQLVWRQEGQKWTQFRRFNVVLLHGPNKDKVLKDGLTLLPQLGGADIFVVNYEGLDWLCDKYYGRQLPFDIVTCDELTKLKKYDGKRAKKLRACTKRTPYKWGLTGTPAPNGYMDLFGQFLWLDENILGKYITHYRDQYFVTDFNGWDYKLQAGAKERIEARIAPHVFRLPYEAMPVRDIPIEIELDANALRTYREMRKEMLTKLPEGVVTAGNAAAVSQKLEQMANGAVYLVAGQPEYAVIHDLKLDALEELIEEMNGQQLLIAYQFEHDLERIQKRFPHIPVLRGSDRQVQEMENAWNDDKISCMLVHPASVAHGLNLQKSSARHICWFSATFNLEHWDQLIRRLRRQGSNAKEIFNHILVVKGTVDELKMEVLGDKDAEQSGLLSARVLQGLVQQFAEELSDRANVRGQSGRVSERGHEDSGSDAAGAGGGARGAVCAGDEPGTGAAGSDDASGVRRPQETGGGRSLQPPHEQPDTDPTSNGDYPMTGFKRLPRQDDDQGDAGVTTPQTENKPVTPKGWGKPAGAATPAADSGGANKEAIRAKVTAPKQQEPEHEAPAPEKPNGRGFFSKGIQESLGGGEPMPQTAQQAEEQDAPAAEAPKPRARRTADKAEDAAMKQRLVASLPENAARIDNEVVRIEFAGLRPDVVKAALAAIAAAF